MQPTSSSELDSIASEIARRIGTPENSGPDCNSPEEQQYHSNSFSNDVEGQVSFCLPSYALSTFEADETSKKALQVILPKAIDSVMQAFRTLYPERATEKVVVHFKSQEELSRFERLIRSTIDSLSLVEDSASTKV